MFAKYIKHVLVASDQMGASPCYRAMYLRYFQRAIYFRDCCSLLLLGCLAHGKETLRPGVH